MRTSLATLEWLPADGAAWTRVAGPMTLEQALRARDALMELTLLPGVSDGARARVKKH